MRTTPPATALMHFSQPMGLAVRAVLFTTGLLLLTALIAAATTWYGAERESDRHQDSVARDSTLRFTETVANLIASGNANVLPEMLREMAGRDGVRRLALRGRDNRVIAEHGDTPDDAAMTDQLLRRVNASGEVVRVRGPDGALTIGAPMRLYGERAGAAAIVWAPDQFKFDTRSTLTPFLVFLGCLLFALIPLAAVLVRRTLAPLATLTRFAETMAHEGDARALRLSTGDEFERLAGALNQILGRLDASTKRIQELAFIDPVTQLPNLDRFVREVDFHLHMRAEGDAGGVVLVFELQRLVKLMPTLAPEAAQDILRRAGERFAGAARLAGASHAGKPMSVARIGAAEFAAYAPGISSAEEAARCGQWLNAALNQLFEWRGHKMSFGAACGAALAVEAGGRDGDALVRHARLALAAAGQAPGRLKLFNRVLDRETSAQVTLEREMRAALEANEFRAFFQPKVDLATGRIEGAEALARWVRPDRTIVGPSRFIPLAEESGLIGPLSDAILREACWKAAAWARAGLPVKMAVNVSSLQFRNQRFADNVLAVVRHSGLPPTSLELEITESVAMEDPDRALAVIQKLRLAGVRFAIDDFGCGHSSLAVLSKLPFDVVKIDQQFVRALERDENQAVAIVEMILALAGALGLEVVAEGIERQEQMQFLSARGCRWAQGFLYGAAVSAGDFVEMLRRQGAEDVSGARAA